MSKIEVNQISSQCGSTLTVGQSGDTVTLAAGATQTGFGRTGTVDWDTTAKTASFTAVSGNGYFVNTTSGAITVTLPASPSSGDIIAIADYANTWQTNNVTVARNGSLINGLANNYIGSTEGISLTFVYVDGTRGWKNVNDGTTDATGINPFIVATGGTVTCCGDYKIHTFTGPGTFTVTNAGTPAGSETVDYLVLAGGGGGGSGGADFTAGGGGGAGGYRESCGGASGCYTTSPIANPCGALPVSVQGYPIAVGGGGAGGPAAIAQRGSPGVNSTFSSITSTGGGGGGSYQVTGLNGGSGGGGAALAPTGLAAGSGNTPPTSPPQGNPGGDSTTTSQNSTIASGGGGGATVAGSTGVSNCGGNGGSGATTSISATPTVYGGGGGGGAITTAGTGGSGIGGNGGQGPLDAGDNASPANRGSGGGGGVAGSSVGDIVGGAGSSGIVIIRYKFQ